MTKEALKLALEALDIVKIHFTQNRHVNEAITAAKKALAQPAQEPVCPECKAEVLYECVACSSNNYPPQPVLEQDFCPRCGKRTKDIHTCTPPQENT